VELGELAGGARVVLGEVWAGGGTCSMGRRRRAALGEASGTAGARRGHARAAGAAVLGEASGTAAAPIFQPTAMFPAVLLCARRRRSLEMAKCSGRKKRRGGAGLYTPPLVPAGGG
jgi:hypothetical protein